VILDGLQYARDAGAGEPIGAGAGNAGIVTTVDMIFKLDCPLKSGEIKPRRRINHELQRDVG
jgi:hypothetical protein